MLLSSKILIDLITFSQGSLSFPVMRPDTTRESLLEPRSRLIFEILNTEDGWLTLPPEQWTENEDYVSMAALVRQLSVVNDAAERSIKDSQDYDNVASDGAYRENILLVSGSHRAKLPDFLKNEMEENCKVSTV